MVNRKDLLFFPLQNIFIIYCRIFTYFYLDYSIISFCRAFLCLEIVFTTNVTHIQLYTCKKMDHNVISLFVGLKPERMQPTFCWESELSTRNQKLMLCSDEISAMAIYKQLLKDKQSSGMKLWSFIIISKFNLYYMLIKLQH